ncbi:hypothetical protein HDU82_003753 [Entophlyctis luteolus]|nr:hypothetical protein HDU82_003753 [Entophlyctis luteolus]
MTEGVVHGTILRSDSIPSSPSHPSPIPPKVLERKGPSRPAGPLAAMFSKATGSGLYSCAIVALGRRMFLFDAPEPLTADQMVRGPARTTKLDTSPISSIFEPISRTSLSTGAIASPTVYSAHFMRQPAKLVLDVSNVCVTEEGLWLLRVSGPDLTHGGSFRDVYLQANSEEEMVGWMRVLKSWL